MGGCGNGVVGRGGEGGHVEQRADMLQDQVKRGGQGGRMAEQGCGGGACVCVFVCA